MHLGSMFAYPKQDLVAGTVVFLVAVPLCLGIAVASGAPPLSGLVAGIVGGLVVPWLSRSPLAVTGPAAGLAAIVLVEIEDLGLPGFLTAVALAGVLQIGLGLLRAGRLSTLVPGAVVKGMLAAIGLTIVLKQLPVALGVESLAALTGDPTGLHPGAALLALVAFGVLTIWPYTPLRSVVWLPAPLAAVGIATGLGLALEALPVLAGAERVALPDGGLAGLAAALPRPDLAAAFDPEVWTAAITVAIVASIETLLSVQAMDRLDPLRRKSPPDRELVAQGVGNLLSGVLGGLPMTAVIVRGGTNVAAGGRERLSALFHGLLLLVAVVAAGSLLSTIPLAALAAVLIKVGLGLSRPSLFREQYAAGVDQFVPFLVTIAAILVEDLLIGVGIGVLVGVLFVLRHHARGAVVLTEEGGRWHIRLRRDGTFVARPALQAALERVPDEGHVVIDATGEYVVDSDFKELIATFRADGERRGIRLELKGLELADAPGGAH